MTGDSYSIVIFFYYFCIPKKSRKLEKGKDS